MTLSNGKQYLNVPMDSSIGLGATRVVSPALQHNHSLRRVVREHRGAVGGRGIAEGGGGGGLTSASSKFKAPGTVPSGQPSSVQGKSGLVECGGGLAREANSRKAQRRVRVRVRHQIISTHLMCPDSFRGSKRSERPYMKHADPNQGCRG